MDNLFNNTEAVIENETKVVDVEKKKKLQEMKESLKETVNNDADFTKKLRRLSGSLKVINTLGFGTSGNIIRDKKASTAEKKVLKPVSTIHGYKIQNIGTEAIEYLTEEWTKDAETGKYVGTVVTKTLAPDAIIDLTREYMTRLCARPEISFTLSNGRLVATNSKKNKSLKDELEAHYFKFSKNEDGTVIQVNDDEVKLSIDDANGVVKPEYVTTFGYLNNPKEAKKGKDKNGVTFTAQDMAANYINKRLEAQSI